MQIRSEKQFLILLINVLLETNYNEISQSVEYQIYKKELLNKRINRICKNYLRYNKAQKSSNIRFLYITGYLIRYLYKLRIDNFFGFNFFNKKIIKVYYYFYYIKFIFIFRLFFSIRKIGFKYHLDLNININNDSLPVIIVADFPAHAFEFSKRESPSTFSSFGEYLFEKYGSNFFLVSLDEYLRKSKVSCDKTIASAQQNITRMCLGARFSPKLFFYNFRSLVSNFSFRNITTIYGCLYTNFFINSIRYKLIIEESKCKSFYVMPFSDFNYFSDDIIKNFTVIQYSENFVVPPFVSHISDKRLDSISGILNPSSLSCRCSSIGFVSFYSEMSRNLLNFLLTSDVDIKKQTCDFPMSLGFETYLEKNQLKGQFISFFDNPPETLAKQLSRSIYGDLTANQDFVEDFLFEILTVAEELGFQVLFKPKYALSNYVDTNYLQFLISLKYRFPDILIMLDPYTRLGDIIDMSDVVISLPFTSTKTFADHMKKNSYYYVPEKYFIYFDNKLDFFSKKVIRKNELKDILKQAVIKHRA